MADPQQEQYSQRHTLTIYDLIRLSTRIFAVKPMRTILTIFGTSIGIGTVVFLISLGYGLQYILLGKLVTTQDSLITLQASFPQEAGLTITKQQVLDIDALPNVSEVSLVAEYSGELVHKDSTGLIVVKAVTSDYFRLSGFLPDLGSEFTDVRPGIIISAQAARIVGIPTNEGALGEEMSVKLFVQEASGNAKEMNNKSRLVVVGMLTDEAEPPLAIIPINELPEEPATYKEIFVKSSDIDSVETVKDALIEKGMLISARLDLVNQAQKILNIITIVLGVFGVAALTVSAVGMFNTMVVSFMERTYEVGVMKSLGAMDSDVRNLFLMESLMMGLAGGVTGIALGMGGGEVFNFALNFAAKRLGGDPFDLFSTPLWFVGLVMGSSAVIGLISGFWPAKRASGLSPKEAFLRK